MDFCDAFGDGMGCPSGWSGGKLGCGLSYSIPYFRGARGRGDWWCLGYGWAWFRGGVGGALRWVGGGARGEARGKEMSFTNDGRAPTMIDLS